MFTAFYLIQANAAYQLACQTVVPLITTQYTAMNYHKWSLLDLCLQTNYCHRIAYCLLLNLFKSVLLRNL